MHHSIAAYTLSALSYISATTAMDMSSSSSSSGSGSVAMMIPYLHFTGGDYLFFAGVAPTSSGAIAGACIVLVVLAVLERAVAAARGIFDFKIIDRRRASLRQMQAAAPLDNSEEETPGIGKTSGSDGISTITTTPRSSPAFNVRPLSSRRQRTMAPFLWAHELIRGGLYVVQAFFLYAIMLVVMTFNAAYTISIIAGSAIGEVFFGRFIVEATH
ncbi:hypothetical protein BDV93DRAFT_518229 [Ceratobasidium sp. AG-I]|nr:hypothetical protein BDV93DRAFT_518229 [Ceratobasidium sp. AG-I]